MDAPLPEGLVEEIESILNTDREPAGRDFYMKVFESNLLFPLQRVEEMERMIQLARTVSPRVVMEIGTDKGGGAYHWLKCLRPHRFCGIEIRGVPYGPVFDKAFPSDNYWLAQSSYSQETIEQVVTWLLTGDANQIDVLFIDGDKSNFKTDFDLYIQVVRPGGIVFMHDIRDKAPREAYDACVSHPRVRETMTFESTREVVIAIDNQLQGLPPKNAHEAWLRHWKGSSCGVGVFWV